MNRITATGGIVSSVILLIGAIVQSEFLVATGCINLWLSVFTDTILNKQQKQEDLLILMIDELTKLGDENKIKPHGYNIRVNEI